MKAIVIEDNPGGVTQSDIVVGIPSYNEAPSISVPTQQADKGLSKVLWRALRGDYQL